MPLPAPDLRPYLDELERFSDGRLSDAEQADFEARLETDANLYRAYQAYEQLTADLRWVAGHETLYQRLLVLDQRLDQRQHALKRVRRRKRRQQRNWTIGAALAVVALLVLWLLWRPSAPTAASAWSRYYQPEAGLSDSALRPSQHPLLAEAMRQYRAGHYPPALYTLRQVPDDAIGQDTLTYYNGIFLLSQDDPEQIRAAQPYLRRVATQKGSALAGRARYHLGMAYWRNQQLSAARNTLRAVSNDPRNPYQQDARRTLRSGALKE